MNVQESRRTIERYIEQHGVQDKDARVSGAKKRFVKNGGLEKTRRGVVRKVMDLHGMTAQDADAALSRAMDECERKGIKELLIIHGWGRHCGAGECGILKKLVLDALEYRFKLSVRDYSTAPPRDGGEGATVVRLK